MRTSDLSQRIARQLSTEITTGALKPGDHVRTQALAERFDVSRSPVRQALDLLAERGLLEQRQNRGFFVSESPPLNRAFEPQRLNDEDRMSDYQRLADDWLTDKISDEVTEQALRERYGLTKAKVTDILMRAVREGWAERKQGYGWRFLPVAKTPHSFEQVYRFRMVIEPAAILEPEFRPERAVLQRLRDTQRKMLDSDIWTLPPEQLLEKYQSLHG